MISTTPELLASIKWLREKTGYAAMDCREALIAAAFDRHKAKLILQRKTQVSMKQAGGVMDG